MLWIALDGAVNVRDVGAMATVDGAQTAPGRLLRADNLQGLTAADVSRLVDDLHVTRVIDLRTLAEVTSEGPGPLVRAGSVEHVHHSLIPLERDTGPTRTVTPDVVDEVLLAGPEDAAAASPEDVTAAHYLGYLADRPDSVVAALRAIAGTEGAALVHCAAGKDRTGVVVALALLAVGVRRELVVADYAATAERIGAILARLRASPTYAPGLDRITEEQHTPTVRRMERFLDEVDRRHGGVPAWLAGQGFGAEDGQRLRDRLLAG